MKLSALLLTFSIILLIFLSCTKRLGKYIYVVDYYSPDFRVHTDRHCEGLVVKGVVIPTEFILVDSLYDALSEEKIHYCPNCVEDWQYDELMRIKSDYEKRLPYIRKLYDRLSKNYDTGSFEHFAQYLEHEDNRRKLYDEIKDEFDFTDFNEFSRLLLK